MNYPKVSIVMLNWNGLEDTIECLESLKRITYTNYEVIVVDNGSEGNDAQVLEEKFGDYIHLIKNDRNYGFYVAANIAIRYTLNNSNPDYLLLLNNDTIVDPEFVTEMVKVAEADPAIGVAGAKIYCYDEPERLQFIGMKIDLWRGQIVPASAMMDRIKRFIGRKEIDRGQHDSIKEVERMGFWCALLKRKTLETIGLLDERYHFGWEDADYYLRARQAGYKIVYVPKAKVWHKFRSLDNINRAPPPYFVKSYFQFMREHATRWQYCCFLIYFFGFHLWLLTGSYLMHHRHPRTLLSFYKRARDGLFSSGG